MNRVQKHKLLIDFFKEHTFTLEKQTNELLINATEQDLKRLLQNSSTADFDSLFAKTNLDGTYRLVEGNLIFGISIFDKKKCFLNL